MRNALVFILICVSHWSSAQDLDYVREQAARLSAPSMSGRGYVDKGVERAADLLAKEFSALGLEPLSTAYRQVFEHDVNTFPGDMLIRVGEKVLVPGEDFLVEPNSPKIKGRYKAVVVDGKEFASQDGPQKLFDPCKNCVFVIEMSGIESKEIRAQAYKMRMLLRMTQPVIWSSNEKLTWSVGGSQLPHPLIEMRSGLVKDGDEVVFDICAKLKRKFKSENVIGAIQGTVYPDSFVVFTAHYDHLGMMGDDATFFGANDNASGTAFLLSLAKHYAAQPAAYTTVFIAFAAEEAGLVGSKYFVDHPLIDLDHIRFLINMDLMGSGIDGITVVNAPAVPLEFQKLQDINEAEGYLPLIKSRKQTANSDHYYFAEQGVPAVFIYALGGSTAYHDIYDVNANLTFDEYEDIFRLLTDLVAKF